MLEAIKSLEFTEILGILGFVIAMVNLSINLYESFKRRSKLDIHSLTPPQDVIFDIKSGAFFNNTYEELFKGKFDINKEHQFREEDLTIRLAYINKGGTALQILNQLLYIKDVKNKFFTKFL